MTYSDKVTPDGPVTPLGLNHLVLNVRDLEESHRFWTEILGFVQVGELHPSEARPNPPKMRFYSGKCDGKHNHHDLALMENRDLPAPPETWTLQGMPMAINHVAVAMPNLESWRAQVAYIQSRGITIDRRVDHGMTLSIYIHDPNGYGVEVLYELPRDVWEGDIDAALNYLKVLPTSGERVLEVADTPVFGARSG